MTELDKLIAEYNSSMLNSHITLDETSKKLIPENIPASEMRILRLYHGFSFDYDTVFVDIKTPQKTYSILGRVDRRPFRLYDNKKEGTSK